MLFYVGLFIFLEIVFIMYIKDYFIKGSLIDWNKRIFFVVVVMKYGIW